MVKSKASSIEETNREISPFSSLSLLPPPFSPQRHYLFAVLPRNVAPPIYRVEKNSMNERTRDIDRYIDRQIERERERWISCQMGNRCSCSAEDSVGHQLPAMLGYAHRLACEAAGNCTSCTFRSVTNLPEVSFYGFIKGGGARGRAPILDGYNETIQPPSRIKLSCSNDGSRQTLSSFQWESDSFKRGDLSFKKRAIFLRRKMNLEFL